MFRALELAPRYRVVTIGVRDIMGYCVTALLFSGVVFTPGLYLFQPLAGGGATHEC
ncbi:TIGR00366 family protein [Paraburkholderia sp. RL17-337-BIB-A]|uniref:TIGR00366 family protein n=1 Tax=Paraburkholderia sp. RL17-337-BIB-A TaxID=3031636 RepID=UPI0038BCAC16